MDGGGGNVHRSITEFLNNKLAEVGLINLIAFFLKVLTEADFLAGHRFTLND